MKRARTSWISSLLSLGVVCTLIEAAAIAAPREMLGAQNFLADTRLRERVPLQGRPASLKALAEEIGRSCRIPLFDDARLEDSTIVPSNSLVLQPEFMARRVIIAGPGASASELMEAMEIATGARWFSARGNWVLAEQPAFAELCVMSWHERHLVMARAFEESVQSLTPAQVRVLSVRGKLEARDLLAQQRKAIRTSAQAAYVIYGTVSREALEMSGLSLRLEPRSEEAPKYQLKLYLPQRNGRTEAHMSLLDTDFPFPFAPPQQGGVPPFPRNEVRAPWDRLRGLPVQSTSGVPLKDEELLTVRFQFRSAQIHTLVAQIAATAKVNVMLSTGFDRRIIALPPKEMTAAEALEAIAERTGGVWKKVGETYVLQPEPTLEELMRMDRTVLRHWVDAAAAAAGRQLTKRQKEAFRDHGRLKPEQLSPDQKKALQWVAALAFTQNNALPLRALDLDGATLRLAETPDPTIYFIFTSLAGSSLEVASTPYK